ncbi:MAG: hypothetical protein JXA24_04840 [Proteobacteria bacterium]|nr:hypothetical protein [Pseudomonadota bacterium]
MESFESEVGHMAGDAGTIKGIIRRLDRLDGREDGRYTDLPLSGANTTGLCEISETMHREPGKRAKMELPFTAFSGNDNMLEVDCRKMAVHLDRLAGIAEKLPKLPFRMYNSDLPRNRLVKKLRALAFEDLLCFHIVDHMITSLMLGVNPASMTPEELFSKVAFAQYTSGIHLMGRETGIESWLAAKAESAEEGFEIFAAAGRKYGFDTSPFKPSAH